MKKTLDFGAVEARAADMTNAQLWGAIFDIRRTLANADAIDRSSGGATDEGGYYRDEASVYHAEIYRRNVAERV